MEYLKNLALTGKFDKTEIDTFYDSLLKSKRKFVSNQKSPEQKSDRVKKAQTTRQLNKIATKVRWEVEDELGIKNDNTSMALSMGEGRPKELQKKYNKLFINKIEKAAKEAGITDRKAIENAYFYQDERNFANYGQRTFF